MDFSDLLLGPAIFIIVLGVAFLIRSKVTNPLTRRYFIPALLFKILGAIALGLIYQFYYEGGDTLNYYQGASVIFEAFLNSPAKAFDLIFANGKHQPDTFQYSSQIIYFKDLHSYFVVRIAALFSFITLNSYSGIAILFATFSFSGLWAMYSVFHKLYPRLHLAFAIAIFFFPSVFFWGSGILKDTITLGALGWAVYGLAQVFIFRKKVVLSALVTILMLWVIYQVKIYILLCFLPAAILWIFFTYYKNISIPAVRIVSFPVVAITIALLSYFAVKKVGEDNRRYNLDRITQTAESTARWLTYVSEREGGSVYKLGDYDYSVQGIIRKMPKAIWVTLFRPYPWESYNIVMLLSSLESLVMLILTLGIVIKSGFIRVIKNITTNPFLIFCITFAITFAFAVGISTYNFGSLVRYKIPMMPFYLSALFIIRYHVKDHQFKRSEKMLT